MKNYLERHCTVFRFVHSLCKYGASNLVILICSFEKKHLSVFDAQGAGKPERSSAKGGIYAHILAAF